MPTRKHEKIKTLHLYHLHITDVTSSRVYTFWGIKLLVLILYSPIVVLNVHTLSWPHSRWAKLPCPLISDLALANGM